jgi:hypothetical protein
MDFGDQVISLRERLVSIERVLLSEEDLFAVALLRGELAAIEARIAAVEDVGQRDE